MAEGFTAVRAREYHIWQEFVMRLELFDRMTQDERWKKRYEEVAGFIEVNKRNPSKYVDGEKLLVHFLKRNRKVMNAGELKEPRLSMFKELLALSEQYKHKNQYQ